MKLRNKKTGEIYEAISHASIDVYFFDQAGKDGLTRRSYDSLAELNEEWEDYYPKEPLIKDEKIRKAVRAWAEANDFINEIEVSILNVGTIFSQGHWSIGFIGYFIDDLKIGSTYTIAEICGEEEE